MASFLKHTSRLSPAQRVSAAAAAFLLASFLVTGCSQQQAVRETEEEDHTALIWPGAPEPARVFYLKTIYRPADIGVSKGFFRKLADILLGAEVNDIIKPYGLTVDSTGRLIVADTALKRVHIFDANGKKYSYIEKAGDKPLESPIAVATDEADNIYVTDSVAGRVFVYSSSGKFLFHIDAGARPTGIGINKKENTIYVADTGSHTIRVFEANGTPLRTFGSLGNKPGELNYPVDIFVARNGDVLVTDTMNYRIQIFDPAGRLIVSFGRHGDGSGDFGRPKGVAEDSEGNIYVTDALFDTVQVFDRQGNFLLNFGSIGRQAGRFWMPAGLHIDSGDKIYVADSYNKRVQVFEHIGN